MGDEHRDTGAVSGMIEYLFGFILRRVEIDFRFVNDCQLPGEKIIAIACGGKEKRGKREEHFGVVLLSGEAADCTECRQGDIADKSPIEIIDFELVVDVVHISDDEVVVDEGNVIDDVGLLGEDFAPIAVCRIIGVDGDDAAAWCIQVGIEVKDRAGIANEVVTGVGIVEQSDEWCGAFDRAVINAILRVGAVIDVEDEEFAIFGYEGVEI